MSESELEDSAEVLLGRPFLRTAKTIIDVCDGTICLDYHGEKYTFSIDEAMRKLIDFENIHVVDINEPLVQEFSEAEVNVQKTGEGEVGTDEGEAEQKPLEKLLDVNTVTGETSVNMDDEVGAEEAVVKNAEKDRAVEDEEGEAVHEPLENVLKVDAEDQPEVQDGGDLEMEEGNQSVVLGGIEAEVGRVDVVIRGDDLMDLEGERRTEEQPVEAAGGDIQALPANIVEIPDDEDEPEVSEYTNEARLKEDMELVFGNVQIPPAEFTEAEMDASLNTRHRSQGRVPRTHESLHKMAETLGSRGMH